MGFLPYLVVLTLAVGVVSAERSATERLLEMLEREGYRNRSNTAASAIKQKLLADYNGDEPPRENGPTQVKIGLYVNSLYAISEVNMDYSMSFYLRQSWQDPRLEFEAKDGIKKIRMMSDIGRIWKPDTFFRNEKRGKRHEVTVENSLAFVNSTGHVWYVSKYTATFSSPMKLQRYPMDTQQFSIMFESFGYTMGQMYYSWLDAACELDPSIQLPQFSIKETILHDCSQNYTAGAFPCREIKFTMKRDSGYYVMQIFLPSILLVILSWGGFWFSITAMPARVTLGLLTVLVLTTLNSGAQATLPHVSYVKAVDIWMGVCMIFVIASLLESAIVNAMAEKKDDKASEASDAKSKKAERVNKICKIAFPVVFLVFNILFWAISAA